MATKQQPVLYILVGISGSGKSTWAKESKCAYVDPDNCRGNKKERWKDFRWNLQKLSNVGIDIVADATHLTKQHRYITAAQVSERYKKVAVVFHTPFEVCVERRKDRFALWQMKEMRDSLQAITSKERFDAVVHVHYTEERELSLVKL